ncbi:DUF4344 domain-containing metallopeptidase [Streptomyces sp. NPDC046866]|uniref:DUF4344 domain-containing metallopeptidase n=1 Tax=Streptomyces sp. NPDC046866 TaxID=3154921 RepID=UPI003454FDDF
MSRQRRTLLLRTVVLSTAAAALAAACAEPPPPPSARGFAVRRTGPQGPADAAEARLLQDRRLPEAVTAALNGHLDLRHRITVVVRSCAGEGSGYDPSTRRIELCYDDLAEDRELFASSGRTPADDEVAAVAAETLYHEAGHALVDVLGLPVGDDRAEEDAADRFAAFMLLREGPEGERRLRAAAEAYGLTAAAEGPGDRGRDEHAPPAERAAAHLCLLYGAAPGRHRDLAARTQGCAPAWPAVQEEWGRLLGPVLRRRAPVDSGSQDQL